jgi:hypothetical protein
MSIFAQNNGVIALTRCANRKAGVACAIFLIIFGILGKISGVFLSIPNPVYERSSAQRVSTSGLMTEFRFAGLAESQPSYLRPSWPAVFVF